MSNASIQHYTVLREIGRGGMGVVYLASDTKLERHVVIKILTGESATSTESVKRFLREARSAAALNHPNVCSIYQVGEVDRDVDEVKCGLVIRAGTPFIVMEHIEGPTLADLIQAEAPLPLSTILDVGTQIAEGLAEAHASGIVHRDLKPQNVMLTSKGQVKILDFGLAKNFARSDRETLHAGEFETMSEQLTQAGMVVGTPSYMSPEQASGMSVDARSDVFSLGAILSEMATGEKAFPGKSILSAVAKIIEGQPTSVRDKRPDLPNALQSAIERCLAKDPDERFRDAGEIVSGLRRIRDSVGALPLVDTAATTLDTRASSGPEQRVWVQRVLAGGAAVVAIALAVRFGPLLFGLSGVEAERVKIAVLPFRNLGPEDTNYFAQGITEDVTIRLAQLAQLGVISHTSARQYSGSDKSLQDIATELRVDYILEGSVQWEGSPGPERVRITPRLIRAADDTYIWSHTYQTVVTSAFALQTQISDGVARELGLALFNDDATEPSTSNHVAYDYYLRGNDYSSRDYSEQNSRIAAQMYTKAVTEDSTFALGFARLSMAYSRLYGLGYDIRHQTLELARKNVERALAIQPQLPEAQLALGIYRYRSGAFDLALAAFDRAAADLPNHSDLFYSMAAVQRRMGDFDQALENFRRASELDPRSHVKVWEVAETLRLVRRYPEALQSYDRAIALAPEFTAAHASKAKLFVLGLGDVTRARETLATAAKTLPTGDEIAWLAVLCAVFSEDYENAVHALAGIDDPITVHVCRMWIHRLRNEMPLARSHADSARALLLPAIADDPHSAELLSLLGLAYATLGHREEALALGRKATEVLPLSRDAMDGTEPLFRLAWIQWVLGEHDAAVQQLELLCSIPSWVSVARLQIDPTFRNGEDHARFQRLLEAGPPQSVP